MANNLWRDQPSGRISTAGLLTKMPSGVSQLVASEFFEAPAQAGVTASVALVEAADSLSSSGTVASAPILATIALVEVGDGLASTGVTLVGSTAAITEAADVLTVQSTVAVGATAALSQGADTVSSAALIAASGTATLIEANDTLAAQSGVSVGATSSLTESADTVFSNGSVTLSALTGLSEAADTLVSEWAVVVEATASPVEASDTLTASTAVVSTVSADLSEDGDTLSALTSVQVLASGAITENADSLASSAVVQSAGVSATVTLNESPDTLAAQATADTVATVEAVVTLTEAPDALSADAAIGDELSDSWTAWGDSWGDAWGFSWGVFNEPYPSLSPGVRLFVLAELHRVFVQFEVEQIIAVAELNSLSVLDAASALSLTVNVENNRLVATHHAHNLRAFVESAGVTARPSSLKAITAKQQHSQLAVTSRQESIYIAQKTHASTFVRTLPNTLTSRRKRVIQST